MNCLLGYNSSAMNVLLMHKDIPVLKADYDPDSHLFLNVTEVLNPAHIPPGAGTKVSVLSLKQLNIWYLRRGIPTYRVGLDHMKTVIGFSHPRDLLNADHALSVSDVYWVKPEDSSLRWKEVSYFRHPFEEEGFRTVSFSRKKIVWKKEYERCPGNTLNGYHRKAWIQRNQDLVLIKGGSASYQEEPVNEWLASLIGKRLGMEVCSYDVEVFENQIVSSCRSMTDEKHEMIGAWDILKSKPIPAGMSWHRGYVCMLEKAGIPNASKCVDDMIVLDYLMLNSDRHLNNFGILRNPDTLQLESCIPIFDTGSGLACFSNDEAVYEEGLSSNAKFFETTRMNHDALISRCRNLLAYDFSVLEDVPDLYARKLSSCQAVSGISDFRISELKRLLMHQIEAIRMLQNRFPFEL